VIQKGSALALPFFSLITGIQYVCNRKTLPYIGLVAIGTAKSDADSAETAGAITDIFSALRSCRMKDESFFVSLLFSAVINQGYL